MRYLKSACAAAAIAAMAFPLALTGCPAPAPGSPNADFEADVTSGPAPLTVHFTDLSDPGASPITSWFWIFGDGQHSTEQDPVHVYDDVDTYNVSLTVTNSEGTDLKIKYNYITAEGEGEGEGEDIETETVNLPGNVPLVMVHVPAGTYMMGRTTTGELDSAADESPRHQVTVPTFWMSQNEVTKRQWQAVMGTTPWTAHSYVLDDLDSPAVWVSWNDVKAFITELNADTGKTFRLPSEAEWEYACRAGTTTRFYWGDDLEYELVDDYAWWYDITWYEDERYAHIVALKTENDFGLFDMSGNVWEWCEDDYHSTYNLAPTNGSAWIDTSRGFYRVLRGGGWYNGNASGCRSANRKQGEATDRGCDYGIRLVR